jgi:uncharacterized LabA/DUF88 family protein
MKRIAIFIDGNNFYYGLRKIYGNFKKLKSFDFEEFSNFLSNGDKIVNVFYYNARLDSSMNENKYESQKEFFDYLKTIPNFNLVLCKLLKRNIAGTNNFYYVIKEDDIHMAVDMVDGAADDLFDLAIIVSGDGDFVPAVKALRKRGKNTKNVYFKCSSSRNLKNYCDNSIELTKDILDKFFI